MMKRPESTKGLASIKARVDQGPPGSLLGGQARREDVEAYPAVGDGGDLVG